MNPVAATTLTSKWKTRIPVLWPAHPANVSSIVGSAGHMRGWYVNRIDEYFSEDGYDPFW